MTRVPLTGTFHVLICLLAPVGFHKFNVLKVKFPEGFLTVHLTCTDKLEFIIAHSSNMSRRERNIAQCTQRTVGITDVKTAMPIYLNLSI